MIAAAYMLMSLTTGNGTAGYIVPFASMDACLSAMAIIRKSDAAGMDPVPQFCIDATTGETRTEAQ